MHIVHVYREANNFADGITNLGVSLNHEVSYFEEPQGFIKERSRRDICSLGEFRCHG